MHLSALRPAPVPMPAPALSQARALVCTHRHTMCGGYQGQGAQVMAGKEGAVGGDATVGVKGRAHWLRPVRILAKMGRAR